MKAIALVLAVCASASVLADHVNTAISFSGWTIESSEDLYAGSRHTSYPLQNLIDRKPETAWVYSGKDYPEPISGQGVDMNGDYYFVISPETATWMDELRIMNGYNKSQEAFQKNSRAIEIQIFDNESPYEWKDDPKVGYRIWHKPLRTVKLSDTLGEKSIWLPKKKYAHLTIRITGIKRGADDDLCLSELQLRAGGKDLIPFSKVFETTAGDECGCGGAARLVRYDGQVIGKVESEDWPGFNLTKKLYTGIDQKSVWVADAIEGKKIRSVKIPDGWYGEAEWKGSKELKVVLSKNKTIKGQPTWIPMKTLHWML